DPGEGAAAAFRDAHIEGAATQDDAGPCCAGARVADVLVSKELDDAHVRDDLDAITSGQGGRAVVQAGSESTRNGTPFAKKTLEVGVEAQGASEEYGGASDDSHCLAADGGAYVLQERVPALLEGSDGASSTKARHGRG